MKTKMVSRLKFLFMVSMILFFSTCSENKASSDSKPQMVKMEVGKKNDLKEIIISNFRNGDMEKLGTYFAQEISIGILQDEEEISPNSAKILLKDFFSKNKVIGFEVVHNGQSKNGESQYLIGSLSVSTGKKYRVYVGFNKSKINEISIKLN